MSKNNLYIIVSVCPEIGHFVRDQGTVKIKKRSILVICEHFSFLL